MRSRGLTWVLHEERFRILLLVLIPHVESVNFDFSDVDFQIQVAVKFALIGQSHGRLSLAELL